METEPMQMDPERCVTAACDYPEPHAHGFACNFGCPCGESMQRTSDYLRAQFGLNAQA